MTRLTADQIEQTIRQCSIKLPPDPDPLSSRAPIALQEGMAKENYWADVYASNFYIEGSEADLIALNSRTGVIEEYEIKISQSDLMRECIIAKSASNLQNKINKQDMSKFIKHKMFNEQSGRYPNYYSFAVPEALVDIAVQHAPQYAGVLSIRFISQTDLYITDRIRMPKLLTSSKADGAFFADIAKHVSNQYGTITRVAKSIQNNRAQKNIKGLENIAAALTDIELQLKKKDSWSNEAVEFLVHRAVSGMTSFEKDSVRRFFLTPQWRDQDLFNQ